MKLSKIRSGGPADILPFPPCENSGGRTRPQRRNFTSSREGRLSGTSSQNRIFIVLRGCVQVKLLSKAAAARESIYSKKSSLSENKQFHRDRFNFDGQHCKCCFSTAFKVVCFAPPKTPIKQNVHVAPKPNNQIVAVWNSVPHCVTGCAFGWGYCVLGGYWRLMRHPINTHVWGQAARSAIDPERL